MSKQPHCFLVNNELPFCKGCGHHLVTRNLEQALQVCELEPEDVIIVSDIGCIGIVDKTFKTHTVHGLHGRSVALASGIRMGLDHPGKKIIVFIGDGGSTIGMQHMLDAAHKNIDLTVLLCNNMLYGMTGGQPSGLTPGDFKTAIFPEGKAEHGYDFCALTAAVQPNLVKRILASGNFSADIAEAIRKPGFSLVECVELCTSYTPKFNKGFRVRAFLKEAGIPVGTIAEHDRPAYQPQHRRKTDNLLDGVERVQPAFSASLSEPVTITISGSAGEGVQLAAELFCKAAMRSGLQTVKKGAYPVTVGVGFSSADIILSPDEILFTGTRHSDLLVITSKDGMAYQTGRLTEPTTARVYCDESLSPAPVLNAPIKLDFRRLWGAKGSALLALFILLKEESLFDIRALETTVQQSKIADKVDLSSLLQPSTDA